MRAIAAGIFLILIGVLTVCAVNVRHSKRQLAESVSLLLLLLIPPVAGNLIITLPTKRLLSLIGCYVYYSISTEHLKRLSRHLNAMQKPPLKAKAFSVFSVNRTSTFDRAGLDATPIRRSGTANLPTFPRCLPEVISHER